MRSATHGLLQRELAAAAREAAAIAAAVRTRITRPAARRLASFNRGTATWLPRFVVFALMVTMTGCGSVVDPEIAEPIGPKIALTDRQLDFVTAGALEIMLDLSAVGAGPSVSTSTSARAQAFATKMPLISPMASTGGPVDLSSPARTMWRYLGLHDYTISYGQGLAVASASVQAAASVRLTLQGPILFLNAGSLHSAAPGLSRASVGFFAISAGH